MSPSCFDLIDRHVVAGHADDLALRAGATRWSYARLLEEVAAFGGALRHCGVVPGDPVGVVLPTGSELVVAVLACARIGGEHRYAADAGVVVTASTEGVVTDADVVLVKQVAGQEVPLADGREFDWDVVLRAGRTDPAPCLEGAVLTPYDDRTRALLEPLLEGGTVDLPR